jgi:hypothetical protein
MEKRQPGSAGNYRSTINLQASQPNRVVQLVPKDFAVEVPKRCPDDTTQMSPHFYDINVVAVGHFR